MRRMGSDARFLAVLLLAGSGLVLGGSPAPVAAAPPQTFYGPNMPVGAGVARSFVTMSDGIPVAMGMEFSEESLTELPNVLPDEIVPVYVAPLPPETAGTPFRFVLVVYTPGHVPPNTTGIEPAHFHAVFMINPPVQGAAPPFANETAAVAANEVPADHVRVMLPSGQPVIVPGVGVNYDDPSRPEHLPPLSTLGLNFFYYDGHLNGIALGPAIDFLRARQPFAAAIKQPQVYPQPGHYPHVEAVRYDRVRRVHIVSLLDFQPAPETVP